VPGANPWYFLSTEKETTLQAEPLRKSGAASLIAFSMSIFCTGQDFMGIIQVKMSMEQIKHDLQVGQAT